MPDSFRHIPEVSYLRLSITDRCNLQCLYCLPGRGFEKLPAGEILRYEEFLRLARVAAGLGIRKIRVTGGEPLVRLGVLDFLRSLVKTPGLEKVCLTTNGVLLAEMAHDIFTAGIRHLNLSLDTLNPGRYAEITGSDLCHQVLAGLEKALSLGFSPLKINCVVLRGYNEEEILDFARLAREAPVQVRFIEFMPMGNEARWLSHFLPMAAVKARLAALGPMTPVPPVAAAGPAEVWRPAGFRGELGFISPVSAHHCPTCNRLRLTAAGKLRPCLLAPREVDIKEPLRQGASDDQLAEVIRKAVRLKAHRPSHPLQPSGGVLRPMVSIGG